ncbi:MAG: hypothetical protein A3J48_03345 [Candidatus Doudnabacteria bacterium RIFCSPHIGHO2_02_FULL_46_11]|uniref:Uncharacterized protein n=1 Tax=Candidatus Doudnabacteria bacterium RIFCSPHIGHO2_02_FULL_46_11 TaxID=1817832 RepID=A0A1F5P8Q6_9BACT|nr:MAG: hypothetical protein A3J48_03345 [Candidatus Doudnabacteria bacterium RIFCSPHIGHO2_02_FULL_46_11]
MHGLGKIRELNGSIQGAQLCSARYRKLRDRAIRRRDWTRAKRYDGYMRDFDRFAAGEIEVWPDARARDQNLFTVSVGRDFDLVLAKINRRAKKEDRDNLRRGR